MEIYIWAEDPFTYELLVIHAASLEDAIIKAEKVIDNEVNHADLRTEYKFAVNTIIPIIMTEGESRFIEHQNE